MTDLYIILLSYIYIGSILLMSTIISRKVKSVEISRKFVHIFVGNWVFFYPMFHTILGVLCVPLSFVFINLLSIRYKIFPSMEREKKELGTVYYAVSLTILVFISFIFNNPFLLYTGVLIMAYADGLAAIIGQYTLSKKPFKSAPEKSVNGSLTVFIVSLLVINALYFYFYGTSVIFIIFSILFSIIVTGIELTGNRGSDNLSIPIGVAILAALSSSKISDLSFLYISIFLFIILALVLNHALDLKGCIVAYFIGITLYTLGNGVLLGSLLSFFALGSLASKLSNKRKKQAEEGQEDTGIRTWIQVVSNSLPALLLVLMFTFSDQNPIFLFAAFAVFSGALSDTLSSELGMLSTGKTRSIITFKPVKSGVSGGITLLGLLFGFVGSFIGALFSSLIFGMVSIIPITVLGFFGTIIDSLLGALFQRKYKDDNGNYQDKQFYINQKIDKGLYFVDNHIVNWFCCKVPHNS